MRTFEERKAEIRRRSDKRIENRKRMHRLMLAVCVPLVLCAAVIVIVLPPFGFPEILSGVVNEADPDNSGVGEEVTPEIGSVAVGTIQVSKGDIIYTYTDPETVTEAMRLVDNIIRQSDALEISVNMDTMDMSVGDQFITQTGWQMVITDGEAVQTIYSLTDKGMTNLSADKDYVTNAVDFLKLQELLGISVE